MAIKQLNTLDPKLKETYERVMGTSTTPIQKTNLFIPKPVAPQPTIQNQTIQSQPIQPQPTPQPIKPVQPQPIPQSQPVQEQPIQTPQTTSLKKRNKMLPIFLVLAGIVFLIGYTIVWLKIFNLNLPFLPF